MAYKIVVDASKGGSNNGVVANGITEKDYTLSISRYINDRLNSFNIDSSLIRDNDSTISDTTKASYIKENFGTGNNVIVISNRLKPGNDKGTEIIYPLRSNSRLASSISNSIENMGGDVNKYYQQRNSSNTSLDDDFLIRNTPNNQTIVINYGYPENTSDATFLKNNIKNLGEGVVKGIVDFIGVNYTPPSLEGYYIVKKGDTLWAIASKNNTTVDKLKKENNLTSNILSVGQVLKLPTTQDITNSNQLNYVVKKGDTLWKIANTYNTTADEIKLKNNLKSNLLSIGQILIIPSTSKYNIYVVKKGDSLYSIARNNNTTVDEIKKLNNLSSNLISINQKLLIPA